MDSETAIMPGRQQLCTDIDFTLDGETITITLKKRESKYLEFFTREIKSLQAMQKKLFMEN